MNVAWLPVVLAVAAAPLAARATQGPIVTIAHPLPDTIISGPSRIDVSINPPSNVTAVTITVNGRILCTVERAPFSCGWDPGPLVRGHHIRVVASFAGGRDVVANLRTKDVGVTERARVDAVLVPVIVTDDGEFVRGLKKQDFEVFEDGIAQPIASVVSEDAPLDLVLAIDVSGSMERALDEVKLAVKQLLTKLRPGDSATLVGFNDNFFIVAEREKDQPTREAAVDMLASWGGTALYDATVRVLDLVSREWGRKGVVIFSDGDDRNSLTTRETAMSRVHASDAMLYTIGFGGGASIPMLRASLEQYARATGGRPFFPQHIRDLDSVFDDIVTELANQYVLSYAPKDLKQDSRWRNIKVQVRKGKYDVRARRGYRPQLPHRASAAVTDIAMR